MTKKELRAIFEKQIEEYFDKADQAEKDWRSVAAEGYRVKAATLESMAYKLGLKLWEKKAERYPIEQASVSGNLN